MAPAKSRQPREAQTLELGEVGRVTGRAMPKNVPLNDLGVEDMEAFFSPPRSVKSVASSKTRSVKRVKDAGEIRRAERPDKAYELGEVGRKTGVRMRDNVPRNSKGVEDADAFFRSPTNTIASVNLNSAKSVLTIRDSAVSARRRVSSVGVGRRASIDRGRRDTDYGVDQSLRIPDEDDMDVDEESGVSPRSYIKSQQQANGASPTVQAVKRSHRQTITAIQPESSPITNAIASRPSVVPETDISDHEEAEIADQLSPPRAARSQSKGKGKAVITQPIAAQPIDDDSDDNGEVPNLFDNDNDLQDNFAFQPDSNQYDYLDNNEEDTMTLDPQQEPAQSDEDEPAKAPVPKSKKGKTVKAAVTKKGKSKGKQKTASKPAPDQADDDQTPKSKRIRKPNASSQNDPLASSQIVIQPRGKRKRDSSEDIEGLRRSERESVAPLEYWRNERIVYNRRQSGPQPHYGMKAIIRMPKEDLPTWAQPRRKRPKTNVKTNLRDIREDAEPDMDDYAGWDDTTDPEAVVFDFVRQEEVKRRVAFTASMVETKPAGKANYRFQKIFSEGDYLAGGILEIPVNEKKPLKPARDNSYILFCHHGAVRVIVHRSSFTIATGGFFMVPRGNSYEIENIGQTEAQIVFLQGREVKLVEEAVE